MTAIRKGVITDPFGHTVGDAELEAGELELWLGIAGVAPLPDNADAPLATDYRLAGAVDAVTAFDILNAEPDPSTGAKHLPYRWLEGHRPNYGEAWPWRAVTAVLYAEDDTGRRILVTLPAAETTAQAALNIARDANGTFAVYHWAETPAAPQEGSQP